MAGESPTLTLTVNLETSGVQAGVAQATASVKNIAAEADKTSSRFGNLKTVMLGTFAGNEMTKGLHELTGFLKESVQVAEEAQTSIVGLATAMNDAKVNTEANRQVVDKVTESMSNLGFTGNSTREALTKMVTATGSVTEAQKLMGVAADYARIKHMDLNTATTVLTRATAGQMRAFAQYGITLDSTLPKSQAITKAFGELNQKIGGQAAAYAETYAGKLAILSVKTNDLKEKVGTLLLPVLTKLSSWFIDSLEWVTKHRVVMEGLALLLGSVVTVVVINLTRQLALQVVEWLALNAPIIAIVAAITAVAAGFVWAWNKFEGFRKGVVTGIEAILDIVAFLVRAVGVIAEAFLNVVTGPMHLMLKALGFFVPAAKTAADEIGKMPKAVGDFFDGAATKIESFKKSVEGIKDKKINVSLPDFASMLATAGGAAGADPGISSTAHDKVSAAATKQAAALKKSLDELTKLQTDYQTALKDRQDKMDAAMAAKNDRDTAAQDAFNTKIADLQTKHDDAMQSAQDNFDQASADAHQAYTDKMTQIDADFQQKQDDLLSAHNDKIAQLQNQAADSALQIEQQGVDKRQAIIQQSIDAMTGAWQNATKLDLGTFFTTGGDTAEGLVTSMQDQLAKILKLQKDAGDLAAKGYSQSFIDQVIAQGPDVGDKMAQAVLNATPETASQIKALYGQIDSVSQDGLTQLATTMNDGTTFATQAMASQYAQVAVEVQASLAKNADNLQASLATENESYQKALDAATDAHTKAAAAANDTLNKALAKAQDTLTKAQEAANKAFSDGQIAAQDTLTKALEASQKTYDTAIKAINDSTDKQLSALMAKIQAVIAQIQALGGAVSGIGSMGGTASSGGFFSSAPATAPTPYGPGITTTLPTTLSSGAISHPGGAMTPAPGAPSVSINAPITVQGATAPQDIQSALTNMTKFGLVIM